MTLSPLLRIYKPMVGPRKKRTKGARLREERENRKVEGEKKENMYTNDCKIIIN